MEIVLIASFSDPRCKYLRITTLGAGFNPSQYGNILYDNTYDRGWFASKYEIHMEAKTDQIYVKGSSPKNCNNVTQYTTDSSFSVGVDISKDPGFSAQYTISESETHNISDFDIINKSAGNAGDWDFQLGLIKDNIWNIFLEQFMRKAQVKQIPILSKENLQTECVITWYKDDIDFRQVVELDLRSVAHYYHCWVTGDWTEYEEHYIHWWLTFSESCLVDFGQVSA
jgi:hypothetical protein